MQHIKYSELGILLCSLTPFGFKSYFLIFNLRHLPWHPELDVSLRLQFWRIRVSDGCLAKGVPLMAWNDQIDLQLNCAKERRRGQCACSFLGVKTASAHQGLNSHLLPEHSTGLHFQFPCNSWFSLMEYQLPKVATVTSRTRELRVRLPSLYFLSLLSTINWKIYSRKWYSRKMIEDFWILEGLHGIKPQPPPWLLLDKVYHPGLNQRKRTPCICRQSYCRAC